MIFRNVIASAFFASSFFCHSASAEPAKYFEFSSEVQVPVERMQHLITKYGSNVIVGGDVNNDDFPSAMVEAKRLGLKRHVYLEGPGGVTGSSGISPDELERMRRAARSVGIDVSERDWMVQWNKWGWLLYTRQQIINFSEDGFDSVEIDNLYNGIGEGADNVLRFLREHQAWMLKNNIRAKLLLKNMSVREMTAIEVAVSKGELRRDLFSDFAISEEDFSTVDKTMIKASSARIGIQTLDSVNTYAYAAKGEYEIRP